MKNVAFRKLLSCALIAATAGFCFGATANAQKLLKGSVTESGRVGGPGTSLSRHDINKNADPFSGDDGSDDQTLDAPSSAYQSESPIKPPKQPKPPQKPFNLSANTYGNPQVPMMPQAPMAAPPDMSGTPDELPAQPPPPAQPAFNPNDPDSSPDMQLAWDMWHKRVAQAIFERFNFFARAAFRHSPPLMARVSYAVTRDGHIMNLNMQQKSTNVLFNVLVFQAVKSLDGDVSLLQFPQGSRRQFVPKAGTFTQNYGNEGFRYTTGDRETVHPGR